ncbi:hypothetical protein PVAP13_5NG230162 [Panicum virgatum]|uniref:Uncharacterized protein n=1 Tax=Panicum virgatum TaxID=38727 RepID=A0A8T0RQE8_PANVG|nr:hypothetical protein PVAP13_5NG230162 [Panicum virgatum]
MARHSGQGSSPARVAQGRGRRSPGRRGSWGRGPRRVCARRPQPGEEHVGPARCLGPGTSLGLHAALATGGGAPRANAWRPSAGSSSSLHAAPLAEGRRSPVLVTALQYKAELAWPAWCMWLGAELTEPARGACGRGRCSPGWRGARSRVPEVAAPARGAGVHGGARRTCTRPTARAEARWVCTQHRGG